mgnify:CR=1 FL=1
MCWCCCWGVRWMLCLVPFHCGDAGFGNLLKAAQGPELCYCTMQSRDMYCSPSSRAFCANGFPLLMCVQQQQAQTSSMMPPASGCCGSSAVEAGEGCIYAGVAFPPAVAAWVPFNVTHCRICCCGWCCCMVRQVQTLSGEGVLTRWQRFLKAAGVRR